MAQPGYEERRRDFIERNTAYVSEAQFQAGAWHSRALRASEGTIEFAVQGIKACYLLNAGGIGVLAVVRASLLRNDVAESEFRIQDNA